MEKVFHAVPDCPKCHGEGWLPGTQDPAATKQCWCIEEQKLVHYLGPYAKETTVQFPSQQFIGKNLLFVNFMERAFRRFAKGFLYWNFYDHWYKGGPLVLSPYDIADIHYRAGQAKLPRDELLKVELLVIEMYGYDTKNAEYAGILSSLISGRDRGGLNTWVYSKYDLSSNKFENLYGSDFASFLKRDDTYSFFKVNLDPFAFPEGGAIPESLKPK